MSTAPSSGGWKPRPCLIAGGGGVGGGGAVTSELQSENTIKLINLTEEIYLEGS